MSLLFTNRSPEPSHVSTHPPTHSLINPTYHYSAIPHPPRHPINPPMSQPIHPQIYPPTYVSNCAYIHPPTNLLMSSSTHCPLPNGSPRPSLAAHSLTKHYLFHKKSINLFINFPTYPRTYPSTHPSDNSSTSPQSNHPSRNSFKHPSCCLSMTKSMHTCSFPHIYPSSQDSTVPPLLSHCKPLEPPWTKYITVLSRTVSN